MGVESLAVVDTVDDTSVNSWDLFETLPAECQTGIGEDVILHNVGMQSSMPGPMLSDVTLIEGQKSSGEVTVTPIADHMLLGIDFLECYGMVIDVARHQVTVDGHVLLATKMR